MTEDILKRLNGYNESRARMGDGEYALCVDAAEEIARLRQRSASRERMNGQTIATLRAELATLQDWFDRAEVYIDELERGRATLRAEVEPFLKAVAHHKLSAEKAARELDKYKARYQAEGGAASPAAFESDAVPDFPDRGDNFDTVSRGVELGDWIPTA